MPSSKPRPKGYADLTLTQLKTFADRGDARAQQELDVRMGAPRKGAQPLPTSPAQLPLRSVTAPPREQIQNAPEYTSARVIAGRAQAAAAAFPKTSPDALHAAPPSEAMPLGGAPSRLRPPPLPAMLGDGLNDALLYEHLPPGQSLSPDLLSRLQDIASRAPEPEVQPPVVLGGFMAFVGLILLLFGFSVTRGPTGTWYFVGCGVALLLSGVLYMKGKTFAWLVYAATCALAAGWATSSASSWLEAVVNVLPVAVIALFAFTPGTRERLDR